MDYDELVQKLRDWSDTHSFSAVPRAAADAITKLRAERDDAIRHLEDWSSRCGRTEADLAAALERLDSVAERDRLAIAAVEGVQQMRIDLAAAQKERDDALAAVDSNWVTHQQIVVLQQDLAAARKESDLAHWLLRNARTYMNPMHEALCAAIDNVLQKKQAALAGKEAK